jgi:urease accessory protein
MDKCLQQKILKILGVLLVFPSIAMAHTGVGDTSGFMHGFSHPIYGFDHLLAMLAVGLWAVQIGGRATWIVPSAFVAVMVLGGILGFSGVPLPFVETGILASVLILGVFIAGAFRLPTIISVLIVGIFAMFHGYAHGAEMPTSIGAASYSLGFAFSTAVIHSVGIASGLGLRQLNFEKLSRYAGGAIMLSGLYLVMT